MLSRCAEFDVLLAMERRNGELSGGVALARVALRSCKADHAIGWGSKRGGSRNPVQLIEVVIRVLPSFQIYLIKAVKS
jgi:hypothetical protein